MPQLEETEKGGCGGGRKLGVQRAVDKGEVCFKLSPSLPRSRSIYLDPCTHTRIPLPLLSQASVKRMCTVINDSDDPATPSLPLSLSPSLSLPPSLSLRSPPTPLSARSRLALPPPLQPPYTHRERGMGRGGAERARGGAREMYVCEGGKTCVLGERERSKHAHSYHTRKSNQNEPKPAMRV